jgi:hypothetical protein
VLAGRTKAVHESEYLLMILVSIPALVSMRALCFRPAAAFMIVLLFTAIASAETIRIMPLGDSITVGKFSGVVPDDPAYYVSYRKVLKDLLAAAGHEINFVGSQVAGDAVFGDAQHEGHGGWFADDAANPDLSILPNVFGFLQARPAEIVLLHIGTNDIGFYDPGNAVVSEVSAILDEIDRYNPDVWVVLALVINRANGCEVTAETTNYNDLLYAMAQTRAQGGDRIVVVDMEVDAGLDYDLLPDGDMVDCPHPYRTGFRKMAEAWFQGLLGILPTANAGFDKDINPGDTVILDGRGSTDALGTVTIYSWSQTAGTPVALTNANTAQASFTAPDLNGGDRLTFRLTITDDKQHTHSDECDVIINSPPAADGGGDQQVSDGQAVILDGTGSSDPDGAIAAYQWRQVNGSPAVALAGDSTAVANFVAPALGSAGALLTFQLTVTDDRGVQNSDTVVVGVNRPPVPDGGSSGSGGGGGGGCFITTAGGSKKNERF